MVGMVASPLLYIVSECSHRDISTRFVHILENLNSRDLQIVVFGGSNEGIQVWMVYEKKKQRVCLNKYFSVDQSVTYNSKLATSSISVGGGKMETL